MPNPSGDPRPEVNSRLSGNAGDVVQARDVSGGIHFHYGPGRPSPRPRQLPRGIRVFVNRSTDLEQLDELLAARRSGADTPVVYLITGTAGVGKTSLALHWAHRVRAEFPDGQLYVDLRGYDPGVPVSADQALEGFLLALGVPAAAVPADVEAKASLYRSLLADRRMLVILDNAATVGQVRPLVPGTAHGLAVVTSRGRLSGLVVRDGAQRATLDTLTEAGSVELLTATTRDYRSGDDPAEIAELARLCANLPLALRIAAERAASRPNMPLSELIADLRDESGLWAALSVDEGDEADAVRTVFAWSYRALTPRAARLFCLLGLHPGGEFSEAAATALAGDGRERIRSRLDALVGACLLEDRGHGRYHFHDLLRAYAVDRANYEITQDEQLAAIERVCEFYLGSAYQCARQLAHDTTLLLVPRPVENVSPVTFQQRVEAAQWYADERANLVGAVRAAQGTGRPRLALRLATVLERLFASHNHFTDWRTTSEIGLAAARALRRRADEAAMCESLGRLDRLVMRLPAAAEHYARAAAIYRDLADPLNTVKLLNGLAWVHLFGHRLQQAEDDLTEALGVVLTLDDPYWTATVLYSLGYTLLQLGRTDEAAEPLAESLRLFRALDDRLYESMVLTAVSLLRRDQGNAGAALATAQTAVDIARDMGNQLWEGTALLYLGKAQRAVAAPGEALVSYQHAAVILREAGDVSREAMAVAGAGRAYAELGRRLDAADFHRHAAALYRQVGDQWKLAVTLARLADVLTSPDDAEQVRRLRAEAAQILRDYPDPKSAARLAALAE